jgi:excinuclease ABC subunit C
MNKAVSTGKYAFSLAGQRLYPYLKITAEKYPRVLVTRIIENDGAEYFGPFLPETGVRFLIDFLNKTFKLRSCDIEIDGSFDVPCTQFYRKRCVAPCVESLCDLPEYLEIVELVRLFLGKNETELEKRFTEKIEILSKDLNYEKAARLRDVWQSIEKVFSEKDWNLWLGDAVDTFEVEESDNCFFVYLVTQRGRKNLGKRVYIFEKSGNVERLLPDVLRQFYRFHAPREIRVSRDFTERKLLSESLSRRAGRKVKIVVAGEKERKITTRRALTRAKYEYDFKKLKRENNPSEMRAELKRIFRLKKTPKRIEAFDVAHISGGDFVAAKSVWENGKFAGKEYEFWFSGEKSELESLRKFIEKCFIEKKEKFPDLLLIDGGRSHLQAALKGLEYLGRMGKRSFSIISAVKPPLRHGEISEFLTENGERIKFSGESDAHRLLQVLRDEAHTLSNQIHRQKREMSHFYELAEILPSINEKERQELLKKFGSIKRLLLLEEKDLSENFGAGKSKLILRNLTNYRKGNSGKIEPLIVPIRFDDENGDAKNLQPLSTYK